jgi:hypothetical protein
VVESAKIATSLAKMVIYPVMRWKKFTFTVKNGSVFRRNKCFGIRNGDTISKNSDLHSLGFHARLQKETYQ